jgi:acetyl esterase/lipase
MESPLTFTFKTVDGINIECDVWLPEQSTASENGIPAMVWFHGGGGFFGDKGPDKSQRFSTWIKGTFDKLLKNLAAKCHTILQMSSLNEMAGYSFHPTTGCLSLAPVTT